MKNFKQPGKNIDVAAPADVLSGQGVLVGKLFGVAEFSAKSGEPVSLSREGVFELPKTNAQDWTVGAVLYWDGTKATTADNSGANTKIGWAAAAAINPSPLGDVLLGQ